MKGLIFSLVNLSPLFRYLVMAPYKNQFVDTHNICSRIKRTCKKMLLLWIAKPYLSIGHYDLCFTQLAFQSSASNRYWIIPKYTKVCQRRGWIKAKLIWRLIKGISLITASCMGVGSNNDLRIFYGLMDTWNLVQLCGITLLCCATLWLDTGLLWHGHGKILKTLVVLLYKVI